MVKITINQKECIGCSFCGDCLSEVFEVDQQDFKCKLKKDGRLEDFASVNLSEEQLKKAKEAAEGCPVQAINIAEE